MVRVNSSFFCQDREINNGQQQQQQQQTMPLSSEESGKRKASGKREKAKIRSDFAFYVARNYR
jgi:hypothetical protein